MTQRLALYATLGLLLSALEYSATSAVFWAMLGLMWSAEHLARQEGRDSAVEEAERLVKYAEQLIQRAEQMVEQQQQQQSKQ